MSELTILGAAYGRADVTAKVRGMVKANASLVVTANDGTFGDSWPGVKKSLVLVFRFGTNQPEVRIVSEDANVTINEPSPVASKAVSANAANLLVYGAAYGLADVTAQVRNQVTGTALNVVANNATYGDSWPGVKKSMVVVYEGKGGPTVKVVEEDAQVNLQMDFPLQILGATYGPTDVADKVRARIDNQEIHLTASNTTFSDTWPGVKKSLMVTYQYGNQQPQTAIVEEDQPLNITFTTRQPSSDPNHLQILGAAYGLGNVTARAAGLISNNALIVTANNQTFQDQWPGVKKTLSVTYQFGQETPKTKSVKEDQNLQIERNA